ncbi:MAG: hypothetical protein LBC40_03720 [Dysgonamonadaceae bacterium]|jgi:hypothetical protein|nr:hypothetical protein [Dysgonamonadaceae bacterium]
MTILDLIKTSCVSKGVPDKYAERIQKTFNVEKEDAIGASVDAFKENILPAIAEAEQAAQALAQKTAAELAVAEYEKKHNLKEGKPVEGTPDAVDTSKLPPEIKALIEAQQGQIDKLSGLMKEVVTGQQRSQKLEIVRAKLKGRVDEDFIEDLAGRVNLDAENPDAEIEVRVREFGELKKKMIAKAVSEGGYVPAQHSGGSSDSEFESFLKEKETDVEKNEFGSVKF